MRDEVKEEEEENVSKILLWGIYKKLVEYR